MDAQKLDALMEQAVDDADLVSAEIPSIDLYLEQILQLVAEKGKISNYDQSQFLLSTMGKWIANPASTTA